MDFDTGARLRQEREKRRMSQRQLAAVTGVTSGMISMIEQNRTSPSVATMKKILSGLGISLGDFFAGGAETGALVQTEKGVLDIAADAAARRAAITPLQFCAAS